MKSWIHYMYCTFVVEIIRWCKWNHGNIWFLFEGFRNKFPHTWSMYIYLRQALLFYLNASDIMQYWLNIKIKGIFDSKWIFKKVFNPFHASGLFLYPQKILENQGFCDVSRDIERDQWSEIVSEENKLRIAFSLTCSLNTAWFYVCLSIFQYCTWMIQSSWKIWLVLATAYFWVIRLFTKRSLIKLVSLRLTSSQISSD